MKFWIDILKKMADIKYITEEDLYKYSEEELVNKIKKCPNKQISKAFSDFQNANQIGRSETKVEGKYCISLKTKKRYTNPLVMANNNPIRIENASKKGKSIIEEIKNFKDTQYAFLNIQI